MGDAPKFAWPPIEAAGATELFSAELFATGGEASGGAESPGARGGAAALLEDTSGVRPRSWWRQIEDAWLGVRTPPLAERLSHGMIERDRACPRCGSSVGPYECRRRDAPRGHAREDCPACREKRLAWDAAVRLGAYAGQLREVLHDAKFTGWARLGHDVGRLLGAALVRRLVEAGLDPGRATLVPIPTSFPHRVARGIDLPRTIARGMSEHGFGIVRALGRRHGPSQLSVPPSQRRANVARAFYPRRSSLAGAEVVCVVDDIRTTGATMMAAARVLRDSTELGIPEWGDIPLWCVVVGVTGRREGAGTAVVDGPARETGSF